MKSKKLKLSAILLTVTMLGGLLAGCGSSENKTNTTGDKTNTGTNKGTNAGNTTAEDKSPITFSLFSEDPSPNWNNMQDDIGKVLTEKTGVTLNAEYAVGDPTQKVALIATSGEYPDLISAKGESVKWLMLAQCWI